LKVSRPTSSQNNDLSTRQEAQPTRPNDGDSSDELNPTSQQHTSTAAEINANDVAVAKKSSSNESPVTSSADDPAHIPADGDVVQCSTTPTSSLSVRKADPTEPGVCGNGGEKLQDFTAAVEVEGKEACPLPHRTATEDIRDDDNQDDVVQRRIKEADNIDRSVHRSFYMVLHFEHIS